MTSRELAFIRSAAKGIRKARADFSGPDSNVRLEEVIEQLFEEQPAPLTNAEIAYCAFALVLCEERGIPLAPV